MFDGKYFDWNSKKLKGILDFYGYQFLNNKRVLDLGCGYADISGALYRLGANVTAVDARQEHLKIVSKRYSGIKTVKVDLDKDFPFHRESYDLILDLSLLCHLSNYEKHLRSVCAATQYLILETAVCDSDDENKHAMLLENSSNYDVSINGQGVYPSPAAIERVLQECGMSYQRLDNPKFNSGSYRYDWRPNNDNSYDFNKRRIWFCVKNLEEKRQVKNTPAPTTLSTTLINNPPTYKLQDSSIIATQPIEPTTKSNDKKLKVALCISGHLRTFDSNFLSVQEHILSKFDCDVFIHTWDTLGLPYRPLDNNLKNISINDLRDKLNKLYNPKGLVIEPRKEFTITQAMKSRLEPGRDVHGMLSMFYKIEACNTIKSEYEKLNNIKYDVVIRFRGDIFMEAPLPIDKHFNNNYLYVPMYGNYGGLCDQIAFGSSDIMNQYGSLYSNLQRYLENGAIFNPEKIMHHHVMQLKLLVSKVYVKFLIKRSNGLIQDNMLLERALGFIR